MAGIPALQAIESKQSFFDPYEPVSLGKSGLKVSRFCLGTGVLDVYAPWTLSYLPAAFGAAVIVLAFALRLLPARLEQRVAGLAPGHRRVSLTLARLAAVPATLREGMGTALELARDLQPGLIGAVVYWGFDIAAETLLVSSPGLLA